MSATDYYVLYTDGTGKDSKKRGQGKYTTKEEAATAVESLKAAGHSDARYRMGIFRILG